MSHRVISTDAAPKAIGTYSQGIHVGRTVYLSGQIPIDPSTGHVVEGGIVAQIGQVFRNIRAVTEAAGGDLTDLVQLTVYLTNIEHFPLINEAMAKLFEEPFPARAVVGVAALPLGVEVEIVATLVADEDTYSY